MKSRTHRLLFQMQIADHFLGIPLRQGNPAIVNTYIAKFWQNCGENG
jgi:hypothetical protein